MKQLYFHLNITFLSFQNFTFNDIRDDSQNVFHNKYKNYSQKFLKIKWNILTILHIFKKNMYITKQIFSSDIYFCYFIFSEGFDGQYDIIWYFELYRKFIKKTKLHMWLTTCILYLYPNILKRNWTTVKNDYHFNFYWI